MEHDLESLFANPERALAALALLNSSAIEPLSGFVLALQLVATRGALAGIPDESPFGDLGLDDSPAGEDDDFIDEEDDDFETSDDDFETSDDDAGLAGLDAPAAPAAPAAPRSHSAQPSLRGAR